MREILVVVSRIKSYIRHKGQGMSTSADTMDALTDIVEKNVMLLLKMQKKIDGKRL